MNLEVFGVFSLLLVETKQNDFIFILLRLTVTQAVYYRNINVQAVV